MRPEQFTHVTIIGTPAEIALFKDAARRSGRLVWASAPHPVTGPNPNDPRMRVSFRLTSTR